MVLGGLEGALLGTIATLFVISLAPGTRAPILDSTAGKVVGGFLDVVQPALPAEVRTVLVNHWDPDRTQSTPRLAAALADDIKSSLKPTPSSGSSATIAEIEKDAKALLDEGKSALSGASAPEKSDPSLVKSALKRENERLSQNIQSRLGNSDEKTAPSSINGFLKKSSQRIGAAVTDTIDEEIDNLGEGSNGRKIERR
jgi:hypothetical protein